MSFAGVQAMAAEGTGLVDRWRDLGPIMWAVFAGSAAAWVGLIALLGAWLDPRRVAAGPATLDPPGDESPAVVNLLTTDWDLGFEAVPATLVDLAARRHLEIDLVGDETFVRTRSSARADDRLTNYERMVLDHVATLARQADDGRVPAAAMSTGPEQTSSKWWTSFRRGVVDDARARGLSRARWSAAVKTVLVALAIPVALALATAISTLPDDPDESDDNPFAAAVWVGIIGFGGLAAAVAKLDGERDTAAGREAAARWLGMRELLGEDPLFGDQPPAAVAIWDRILAHGTALGIAHGVVRALPLGAESDRHAWSSVGGTWRVVRVRYPRAIPPGYGRPPALALLFGIAHMVVGVPLLPLAVSLADTVRESVTSGDAADALGREVPAGYSIGLTIFVAVIAVVAAGVSVRGAALTLAGLADLITGRTPIEGRALRVRDRSGDDNVRMYLAVDDGSTDAVRAWLLRTRIGVQQGQLVRARVTRWLRHATDIEVGRQVSAPATVAAGQIPAPVSAPAGVQSGHAWPLPVPLTTGEGGAVPRVVSVLSAIVAAAAGTGAAQTTAPGTPATPATAPAGSAAPATTTTTGTAATTAAEGSPGERDRPSPSLVAPPTPRLPDDAAVTTAVGSPMARDDRAARHPAALPSGSALYRSPAGDRVVQLAWVPPVAIGVYRAVPPQNQRPIPGLGDEAYHARAAGALMARRGDGVLMVTVHAPDLAPERRDELATRLAALALGPNAHAPPPAARDTMPPRPPTAKVDG